MKGGLKRKNAQAGAQAELQTGAKSFPQRGAARAEFLQRFNKQIARLKKRLSSPQGEASRQSANAPEKDAQLGAHGAAAAVDGEGSGAREIDVDFAGACGCEICEESKCLDEVLVIEVVMGTESFITDSALVAIGVASSRREPALIRTAMLPRAQFEALKEAK